MSKAQQARNAARAMVELDDFWWENLAGAAIMQAWVATRQNLPRELWDAKVSDAIAIASVEGLKQRLENWAIETDDAE